MAPPIKVIGLTGGIGSGKSTVADAFRALGTPLVDTDLIAHQLGRPGEKGSHAVSRLFGADYLNPEGAIDRGKLRSLVFADPLARKQLEAALHPLIRAQVEAELHALPPDTPYCLLIVPLLFETGAYQDLICQAWVVDCSEEQQVNRIMSRSQLTREQALAIMNAQISRQQRLDRADVVIDNSGDRESLLATVKELHSKSLQGSESAYKSC